MSLSALPIRPESEARILAAMRPGPQGALVLVCSKCTKQRLFAAETREMGDRDALIAGWVQRRGKTICPECSK